MPAHMPSTATPVRYEFKAKSLWTKVDKAQPLKNLARRGALPSAYIVAVFGVALRVGCVAVRRANSYQKEKTKTARRCGRAVWVLLIRFYALAVASAFLRARYSL